MYSVLMFGVMLIYPIPCLLVLLRVDEQVLETGKDQFGKDLARQPRLCAVWVHRTVRWCTRHCPVRQACVCQLAALGKRLTAYDYKSPDYPVSQQSAA
jgi:hypothetical protein